MIPEAARSLRKYRETIRRWIRAGRPAAREVGTQHVVDVDDLDALLEDEELPVPPDWGWDRLPDGRPMPNFVAIIRRQRAGH
jgi:hypothetical protein